MTDMQRETSGGTDSANPASAVGNLLRQARERGGQSLATAAQQLRIRESYLHAIEQGDFRLLPGATYAVGFVRSYADHLGLDPQEIVRRFREEVDELGRRTALVFPSTSAEAKIPGGVILLIAAFVALVGYGGWYYLSDRDGSIAELVPEVPRELQQPAGEEQAATAEAPSSTGDAGATLTPPAAASATDRTAAGTPAATEPGEDLALEETEITPPSPDGGEDTSEAPDTSAPADTTAAATDLIPQAPALPGETETLPVGQQYGVTNADARVVLVAVQESWVQVKKSTGEEVWTKVLRPGDRFMVPNEPGLVLATGNAGGLEIMVDGRSIPRLGPVGVVKRGISLDPERLLGGTATP